MNNIIFRLIIFFLSRFYSDRKYLLSILTVYKTSLEDKSPKVSVVSNNGYLHIAQTIDLVKEYKLSENNLIVDVGAADGYVSSLFANEFPFTQIISFEPIKDSYKKLCRVAQKYKTITPVNKALGMKSNKMFINVANRITASSLFQLNPQKDENFITKNISLVRKEKIILSTLDEEISKEKNINVIKLDVQGYELEALKGSLNALKRTFFIVVEVSNHNYYLNGSKYYEIDEFLRRCEFELVSFLPSLSDKRKILEWDCIYKNKKLIQ